MVTVQSSGRIRMKGFGRKAEPRLLTELLDARVKPLPAEAVAVELAHRRIVAQDIPIPQSGALDTFFCDDSTHDNGWQGLPSVIPYGHRLSPMDLAMFVALETSELAVFPQPRVALLVTGNE